MNRNVLLTLIAVGVVGIFGAMIYEINERDKSPVEKISDSISEAGEEISDEIDDHTTSK